MKKLVMFCFACHFMTGFVSAQCVENNAFQGQELQTILVPVGGIATGDILVGGRGNIEYVEVFNRPDRQRRLEKTFFSLWVKEQGQAPEVSLLERELLPPYGDATHVYAWGLPRMTEVEFVNNYPGLQWQFKDEDIPLKVSMQILNPIVPLDFESSNYPVCRFNWTLENPTDKAIEASIALSMENPVKAGKILTEYFKNENFEGIRFSPQGDDVPVNYQGDFLMATPAAGVEVQTHWYPGTWRDETHIFWDDFSDDGHIESKKDAWVTGSKRTSYNESTRRMSTVLVPFTLEPGEEVSIPFYFSWYSPLRVFEGGEVFGKEEARGIVFENAYGKRFDSAGDVLSRFLQNEEKILGKAQAFADVLCQSSFPESVKEALNTQVATLVSPLIQVTADGEVHGFEGVLNNGWCCPGSCTHVWNYEQALASLYPSLERSMREIEFSHNTFEDGFQVFRSIIPTGDYWFGGPAAADGQMGTIVRVYRDWKLCGDNQWLAGLWPDIQKSLEFAWTGSGESSREKVGASQSAWDPDKTGLLSGEQHNTYDINFYGPCSMTSSTYLAALKAGSEMALAMGEKKKAREYREVFEKGSRLLVDSLWNGEYFTQIIVDEPGLYEEHQLSPPDAQGKRFPKYQYGDGCLADQLLGQYLAFNAGLGYIAEQEKVDQAIGSVYKYNFFESLRDFSNVQRVYGLNDEAGVVLCTWPHGNRPVLPFVYAQEIWTGVEYQVAASLIYSGKTEEGLRVVEAVQDRYNGIKRNPFGHNESGVQYARALASWSVLLALSGIEYNGLTMELSFFPKMNASDFRSFWSTGSAWGEIIIHENESRLEVMHGTLALHKLTIRGKDASTSHTFVYKKGKTLQEGETLVFY
jgi:uncharacterized protein (DUF608 family)